MYTLRFPKEFFKMDRTQIYLTPEQKEALLDLSKNTSTSMAELIRLAIDEYLSKKSQDNRLQAIQETFGAIPEWVDDGETFTRLMRAGWKNRTLGGEDNVPG
jgi:predicted DNA-binding protein